MLNSLKFAVALIAIVSAAPSPATLHEADSEFGPGTVTLDSETGLAWLDLTVTVNISGLEMAAELEPGGLYSEWRYPTEAEIATLFYCSAGLPGEGDYGPEYAGIYLSLLDLTGITTTPSNPETGWYRSSSYGVFGYSAPENLEFSSLGVDGQDGEYIRVFSAAGGGAAVDDMQFPHIGHWLVQDDAIPGTGNSSWSELKALYR